MLIVDIIKGVTKMKKFKMGAAMTAMYIERSFEKVLVGLANLLALIKSCPKEERDQAVRNLGDFRGSLEKIHALYDEISQASQESSDQDAAS